MAGINFFSRWSASWGHGNTFKILGSRHDKACEQAWTFVLHGYVFDILFFWLMHCQLILTYTCWFRIFTVQPWRGSQLNDARCPHIFFRVVSSVRVCASKSIWLPMAPLPDLDRLVQRLAILKAPKVPWPNGACSIDSWVLGYVGFLSLQMLKYQKNA